MNEFNEILTRLIESAPLPVALFAAIGLSTVAFLTYQVARPVLGFLFSTKTALICFWAVLLIVSGGTALGYSQKGLEGGYQGFGVSALITGTLILGIFWLRKFVKWNYNEQEDYT